MGVDGIPTVDLSPWFSRDQTGRQALCETVGRICHEIGFFYVINHGIRNRVCDNYMTLLKAFFELPESEKQRLDKFNSPHFRGWEKLGSELTNNETDYREQLDIGVEQAAIANPDPYYMALVGPNQWPDEKLLPGFRNAVQDYMASLSELSRQLLRIMALSLGLSETHIEEVFGQQPSPYTKLIRYPKTTSDGQGVGVHKDSGFLTLLLQDSNPGLEAQSSQGQWFSVAPLAGSFVVNIGELLQLLSQNYFIAAPHRVINRSNKARYSSAFFYSPDLNTALKPLAISSALIQKTNESAAHNKARLMASRTEMESGIGSMDSKIRPDVFGEKYWHRWVRSYPDIAQKYHPQWI